MDYATNSIIGFVFGFALQKARMFDPTVIQSQLLLQDFTMMRTFLASLGTSQLLIGSASLLPGVGERIAKFKEDMKKSSSKGYTSVIVGSSLLGVGMALAGSCPGTIYAQIGSSVPGSKLVLYGAITGIALFSLLETRIKKYLDSSNTPINIYLEDDLGYSYSNSAIVAGMSMIVVSNLMSFLPNSALPFNLGTNLLTESFWTPQIAGSLIGLLPLSSLLFLNVQLGMSSSLVAATSFLAWPLVKLGLIEESGEWNKSRKDILGKSMYAGSVVGGAMVAALLGSTYGFATGLTSGAEMPFVSSVFGNGSVQAFVGGVLLWLGARIGGGCTSGHGISGFSFLKKTSFVAVQFMFLGGIGTMMLMKVIG